MRWLLRGSLGAVMVFVLVGCSGSATSFGFGDDGGPPDDGSGTSVETGGPSSGSSSGGRGGSSGAGSSSSSGGPGGSSSSGGGGASSSSSGGGGSSSSSGGSSSSGSSSSSSGSSGGMDAGTDAGTVRYSTTVGPILDRNCTQACHGGCGGLNISYANIVNVKAGQSNLNYITPNDPGRSYLFCKVSPNDATCTSAGTTITGSRMPPGGALSAANLASIKSWIQGGAPN